MDMPTRSPAEVLTKTLVDLIVHACDHFKRKNLLGVRNHFIQIELLRKMMLEMSFTNEEIAGIFTSIDLLDEFLPEVPTPGERTETEQIMTAGLAAITLLRQNLTRRLRQKKQDLEDQEKILPN